MPFVLASASPRRRELLQLLGLDQFSVLTPNFSEPSPDGLLPANAVRTIALQKAKSVAPLCAPDDIIIAADTLVFLNNSPLGKPLDPPDAVRMLKLLSGRHHLVCTGIAVLQNDLLVTASEDTRVFFREISDSEINHYVSSGDPLDKAGAYGAQGPAAKFIRRIEGDFFNVIGLPICRLSIMLRDFGVFL